MFSLICAWIKGWVNNGEAGDLKRYLTHYDVTVMNIRKALEIKELRYSLSDIFVVVPTDVSRMVSTRFL